MKTWLQTNRKILLRAAGTLLAILLLALLLWQYSWQEIWASLQKISALQLALAFGLIMLSRLLVTLRWHVLLRSGGIKIPFRQTASLVFTGLFSNNFLPTTVGGDVIRLAGAMQLGYDQAICLASIAADRVINMVGMSLAAPLGIWQLFTVPAAASLTDSALQASFLGNLWQKGWDFLRRTIASFALWLNKPAAVFLALGFALLHMLASFSANYVLLSGLGESIPLWKVVGLFSLAYFVSLIPVSINGYGVQELTVTFLLSHFGGVSLPASASVAVIHRLFMMIASLPGALTLPGIMSQMDQGQKNKK